MSGQRPDLSCIADEYVVKLWSENRSGATVAKIKWPLSFANEEFGDDPVRQIAAPQS